jgi:hypothetical protein
MGDKYTIFRMTSYKEGIRQSGLPTVSIRTLFSGTGWSSGVAGRGRREALARGNAARTNIDA